MKKTLLSLLTISSFALSGASLAMDNNPSNKTDSSVSASQSADTKQVIESVNINSADVELLTQLTGVGKKKAEAIVEYREFYGKFTSAEDLLNVKGIGEKILKQNENRISL